jgi:hypothetical protein
LINGDVVCITEHLTSLENQILSNPPLFSVLTIYPSSPNEICSPCKLDTTNTAQSFSFVYTTMLQFIAEVVLEGTTIKVIFLECIINVLGTGHITEH